MGQWWETSSMGPSLSSIVFKWRNLVGKVDLRVRMESSLRLDRCSQKCIYSHKNLFFYLTVFGKLNSLVRTSHNHISLDFMFSEFSNAKFVSSVSQVKVLTIVEGDTVKVLLRCVMSSWMVLCHSSFRHRMEGMSQGRVVTAFSWIQLQTLPFTWKCLDF